MTGRRGAGGIGRVDVNQGEIVRGLLAAGASVWKVNRLWDLVVGYRGRTFLLEIKRDEKAKLKPSQERELPLWRGQIAIVWKLEQALEAIGATDCSPSPMTRR